MSTLSVSDQLRSINQNTNSVNKANSNPGDTSLGQDSFLNLLVQQLRNQDPLNPQDGAQMAAQLAQFSQVEQMTNVNDNLQNLLDSQNNMSAGLVNTMAVNLTGKEVTAMSDVVKFESGDSFPIDLHLGSDTESLNIKLVNGDGTVVREINGGTLPMGDHRLNIPALSDSGNVLPKGDYQIVIEAYADEAQETPVQAYSFIKGKVGSLKYTGEGVILNVDGRDIYMGDVVEIDSPSND